ncbi:unnamed protein product, partial [Pylaiella littoralis]
DEKCSDGTPGVDGNGVVCCSSGCTQCGGPKCSTSSLPHFDGSDCCGGTIKESGVYCDESHEAPCIIRNPPPDDQKCSDGTPGVDGNGVVCCSSGCTQCGG